MENRIKPVFDQIRAEESLKQSTLAYLSEKTKPADRHSNGFGMRRLAGAVCVLVLFLGGWFVYQIPTASISIDINPSVELSVNFFDRVISVKAYNDDGQELLNQIRVIHLSYEEAVERILEEDSVDGLLNSGELMMLSVIGPEGTQVDRILAEIEACTAGNKQMKCCYASPETAEQAHAAEVSAGKYRAFLELRELDPDVTLDDIRDLTMRQIRELMEQCNTGDEETTCPEDPKSSGHHGNGDSAGHGTGNPNGQNGDGQKAGNGNGQENGYGSGDGNGNGYRGGR